MGHELNPTTGKPTFNNTPSTVSDLQAAADYSERLGDASVPTVADLENVEYPRKGETRRVDADGSYWGYDGSAWARTSSSRWASLVDGATSTLGTGTNIDPLTGSAACSVSVTLAVAAKVSVTAFCGFDSVTGLALGVSVTGATTVNTQRGGAFTTNVTGAGAVTNNRHLSLNAGTSIIHVAAGGIGSGGARTVSNPGIVVELA